jgi:hypothetical protein
MKQLTVGKAALFLLQGVLLALGWALRLFGGAVEAAASHERPQGRSKAAELDQDGYVVKEGTTDLL